MCGAATITVAEVELVPVGSLDPNHIHIPGIFLFKELLKEKIMKNELSN